MKRGQTTLEYAILIGFVAAGVIAMIFYVSRGHQGSVRYQADQLSAIQYAPGNTRSNNNRLIKTLTSTASSGSSTTVTTSEHPVGQGDPVVAAQLELIRQKYASIYDWRRMWEEEVVNEAKWGAELEYKDFSWKFPTTGIAKDQIQLDTEEAALKGLDSTLEELKKLFPKREADKTTSTSWSSETGRARTERPTNIETLGNL